MSRNTYEDYKPYIEALEARGLAMNLAERGGGCVALWMKTSAGEDIYTLGPFVDDRYNGFEVISGVDVSIIAAYEPPDPNRDRDPVETADLLAPALHRYLNGDKTPLPGWQSTLR
jgi:hypothetical protein